METLLNRYRNITVLLLVIFAQIVLLAYQVKNDNDVRVIRVWSVTAVTPIAKIIEDVRSGIAGFFSTYFSLREVREDNRHMKAELDRLKLENQFLKTELSTADRVRALSAFETRTPSKMIAARVIGTAAGGASKVVFVDRGSTAAVEKGMAVVTPDGIVGKVLAAYPTASQVLMITDSGFAAGVISQKNRVHGILKGLGYGTCRVDYVQNEEKVEPGEMFYTSGDDRVFPKGLPVGKAKAVRAGPSFKDIFVDPSALINGPPEEVLVIIEGVHQAVPEYQLPATAVYLGPDVKADGTAKAEAPGSSQNTQTAADRLREEYKAIGEAQGHKFGEGTPGSKPPDFNFKVPGVNAPPGSPPGVKTPRPRVPNSERDSEPPPF